MGGWIWRRACADREAAGAVDGAGGRGRGAAVRAAQRARGVSVRGAVHQPVRGRGDGAVVHHGAHRGRRAGVGARACHGQEPAHVPVAVAALLGRVARAGGRHPGAAALPAQGPGPLRHQGRAALHDGQPLLPRQLPRECGGRAPRPPCALVPRRARHHHGAGHRRAHVPGRQRLPRGGGGGRRRGVGARPAAPRWALPWHQRQRLRVPGCVPQLPRPAPQAPIPRAPVRGVGVEARQAPAGHRRNARRRLPPLAV